MNFYVAAESRKPAKQLVDGNSHVAAFQDLRERWLIRRADPGGINLTEFAGRERVR